MAAAPTRMLGQITRRGALPRGSPPSERSVASGRGLDPQMEETAAVAAATETVTETETAEKSSYRYWVRQATGEAAPLPVPHKLDPAAANGVGGGNPKAPPSLGSVG
ncbi:hypothetical protein ZWY2020_059857 [Hordeum vulgare]|nr:hypothetical protein ZWY2020_059857 [Hordeum vulgare]